MQLIATECLLVAQAWERGVGRPESSTCLEELTPHTELERVRHVWDLS